MNLVVEIGDAIFGISEESKVMIRKCDRSRAIRALYFNGVVLISQKRETDLPGSVPFLLCLRHLRNRLIH